MVNPTIAELENAYQEITALQKENVSQAIDLIYLKIQVAEKLALAEIMAKRYAGKKKFFKFGDL